MGPSYRVDRDPSTVEAGSIGSDQLVAAIPRGKLGFSSKTANQGGITTSLTDITSLSVSVTVGTGRLVRISGSVLIGSSAANDSISITTLEGAAVLQDTPSVSNAVSYDYTVHPSVVIAPSAGAHTYKFAAVRNAGAGTIHVTASAAVPSFILVEDIGAA